MPRGILLIDDDRLQHRLTAAHFGAFHGGRFDLERVGNYEEGPGRLLSGEHAARLLDYQLGERDGLRLIREAAAGGRVTPIIFPGAESRRSGTP